MQKNRQRIGEERVREKQLQYIILLLSNNKQAFQLNTYLTTMQIVISYDI